ncbi:MAG: DUF2249 domain-containing protein [Longimicrobiales bacterium]|nr:DUF2249 domain-containing protein [Longimicrobiales bacterium]
MTSPTPQPRLLEEAAPSRILDLDVRDDLRSGREPFQRIMHARQALAHDGILRLRAIFEPRPLYGVMRGEGFAHWTERLADDDWRIWFYRDEASTPTGGAAPDSRSARTDEGREAPGRRLPTCGSPRPEPSDVHLLDVRGLEPPEPMVRTLEALSTLPPGHTLVQVNARVPALLLPELERRGFQYTIHEEQPEVVRVFIRRAEETPVLDVRLLPPREKHPTIFRTFDALAPGEAFTILNDHDPLPLRYQFQAERPNAFTWRYLEEGPEIWRVEIGRTA